MKVLLFGAKGYLGQAFLGVFPDAVTSPADIADPHAVAVALDKEKPDVVINAAGKTGRPNVDWCETHKEETLHGNVTGPLVLLEACMERNVYMVHISSGCIYEGDNGGKGFTEEDPPNFFGSFYSRTKAWTDVMFQDFPVLQLRLRMPFDGSSEPRNLIQKISKYSKVLDTKNSLTYLPDFLEAARLLIQKKKTGTYNIVNPGLISPADIMEMYRDIVDPTHAFEKITMQELSQMTSAGRSNCMLSGAKLLAAGISLPHVEKRVEDALKRLAKEAVSMRK